MNQYDTPYLKHGKEDWYCITSISSETCLACLRAIMKTCVWIWARDMLKRYVTPYTKYHIHNLYSILHSSIHHTCMHLCL
ncbi:hypothetical protein EON63_00925 [archaeon]|nr:MAG: hypothetical protein EON63_00925 [archaeon]